MATELHERPDKLQWLLDRGLTLGTILDASLGYMPSGYFRDSIAIPYYDVTGRLVTVRFRHLDKDAPIKYEPIKGTRMHLYNVKNTDHTAVGICEGEFDSLILGQLGIPSVAIHGATSWRKSWRWLFRNADLVYVITDADEAGRKAGNKLIGNIGTVTDVAAIHLPNGLDVTDLFLQDPDHLRRLLA
jgi:DNA primase